MQRPTLGAEWFVHPTDLVVYTARSCCKHDGLNHVDGALTPLSPRSMWYTNQLIGNENQLIERSQTCPSCPMLAGIP